jgi:hypothetical protein
MIAKASKIQTHLFVLDPIVSSECDGGNKRVAHPYCHGKLHVAKSGLGCLERLPREGT